MPRLIAESGKIIGQDFAVADKVILGRKRTCEVLVDDAKSSREHTSIFKEGGSYYVQDLNSSNGTYLNEVRIEKSPLVFGDRVRIGETILVFVGDPEQDLTGTTLSGFQILEKLGHRDIGFVYRARQIALDRIVALKVLDKDLSQDGAFVKRFIDEARAAGTLRHPNIIHVFDVGKANDQYYICMEFVSGRPLRDHIGDESISMEDKLKIAKECVSALSFAHERNIIHKDVTPTNIILTQDKVTKIADMGIAKLSDAPITSRDISSLYYISPEEALAKPVSLKSDMYSLGVCIFELLTGRIPFKSKSAREIIKEHITTPVPSPRDFNPEVPETLAAFCLRLTAISPAERYGSMKEAEADLEKVSFASQRPKGRRAARQPRAFSPTPVASKPVFVDDGRGEQPAAKRKIRIKTASLTGGAVGMLIFAVFLVIIFYISSFVTQLLLEQFSNRPTPQTVQQQIDDEGARRR